MNITPSQAESDETTRKCAEILKDTLNDSETAKLASNAEIAKIESLIFEKLDNVNTEPTNEVQVIGSIKKRNEAIRRFITNPKNH